MIPIQDKEREHVVRPKGPYARFYQRIAASILDTSITLPIQIGLGLLLINSTVKMLIFPLILIIPAVYKIAFEYRFGGTLGKIWLNMKVVNPDLSNIQLRQAINRYAVYFAYDFALIFSAFQLFVVNGGSCDKVLNLISFQCFQDNITSWMSTLVFVSVIWVAFDFRHQALHDKIASTIVIKDGSKKNMDGYIIGAIIMLIIIGAWLMALEFPDLMT